MWPDEPFAVILVWNYVLDMLLVIVRRQVHRVAGRYVVVDEGFLTIDHSESLIGVVGLACLVILEDGLHAQDLLFFFGHEFLCPLVVLIVDRSTSCLELS